MWNLRQHSQTWHQSSESERYLILKVKITEKEYAEIQASWSKQSGLFLPQSHKHRFYAVDLTQAAGGLMPCLRMLTKIPHLGEVICNHVTIFRAYSNIHSILTLF
jgi:hypothetical protein